MEAGITMNDVIVGIFGLLAAGLVIFLIYKLITTKDSIGEMLFEKNPTRVFEMIVAISTSCEVVGLMLVATSREVPFAAAALRYGMIGFMEVMTGAWFIYRYKKDIIAYAADNNISFGEDVKLVFRNIWWLALNFIITHAIAILYSESTGSIFGKATDSLWPGATMTIQTTAGAPTIAGLPTEGVSNLEIGVYIMIYCTTFFMIFLAVIARSQALEIGKAHRANKGKSKGSGKGGDKSDDKSGGRSNEKDAKSKNADELADIIEAEAKKS